MDWVHCNQCFYRPGQQQKRELILTSCGHIFCKSCELSERTQSCKICKASFNAIPLSSQMPQDVKVYFEDPENSLAALIKVVEFQKSHRLLQNRFLKVLEEKYQKLKFAYQKLDEENKRLKKEIEMYRRNLLPSPGPPPHPELFSRNSQESPFIKMQMGREKMRPSTPLFSTPTSQLYRLPNTPSTPLSDSGISPGSVTSQKSYRSLVSSGSGSQQRVYRPGLTPPLNRLSMLSVADRDRDSSSRY